MRINIFLQHSIQFQSQQLDRQNKLQELSQRQERIAFRRNAKLQVDRERVSALETLPEDERRGLTKLLQREFLNRSGGIEQSGFKQLIRNSGNFGVQIPELKIPPLKFPSLDQIRKNVDSIVSEFKKSNNSTNETGKSFTIQTLNMDSPINIAINGADDKEEIAQAVEGAVFNRMRDVIREVETELNVG